MKNIEKYEDEIRKIAQKGGHIAVDKETKKICPCRGKACAECLFFMNMTYSSNCPYAKLEWLLEEYKEPSILNDKEKRYLENVFRPFQGRIKKIMKMVAPYNEKKEYIKYVIRSCDSNLVNYSCDSSLVEEYIHLPCFKKGTMYKGMKVDRNYTLEELGLFENGR